MKTFETKKLYYSIGEVSKITSVPAYLLRNWENEFPQLSPSRNAKGNRIYTYKDIAVVLAIKKLIYEDGYTVEKARAMMQGYTAPNDVIKETKELLSRQSPPLKLPAKHNERQRQTLLEIRAVIEELLERLG
ncbi:MAG: MerR family transcriptional regulator [Candidatus Thermochlorobacter aerophilum]|jgi:DNA-binding transcriptional MerR regulator|uniref:MerR family transcriptional regulator n=1 Tax=Candidatus Thermochlorobacter aerophilus TaxID=1868324 RepID=A0A395M543_9BACT|nr:MAG: MerR family transcriptional regulator [Candidatus Thermochlorobacter aerophilum]RFM25551.1 MAG: MerR family transcriptional regulator [Candidatus Thermochlorobacter aerophilum]